MGGLPAETSFSFLRRTRIRFGHSAGKHIRTPVLLLVVGGHDSFRASAATIATNATDIGSVCR